MKFTHVFSTHAPLQEYLVEAIMRAENISPEEVLVVRVRGSYRVEEDRGYTVLDGSRYDNRNGRNVLKHRRDNHLRYALFEKEVLDRLAPGFQVYAPMYTYWHLTLLADRAAAYHVLEDGFGSYQSKEEQQRYFNRLKIRSFRKLISVLQRRAITVKGQRSKLVQGIALLDGVGRYYCTSPFCFPWAGAEQRVLLKNVFPALYPGRYDGATVMATSCMVESNMLPLEDYLTLLRAVLQKMAERGGDKFYFKLHPLQARHAVNAAAYRKVFREQAGPVTARELGQETMLESLAVGNDITFVTGISSLGFHVAAAGTPVLNYLDEIKAIAPDIIANLPRRGLAIFQRITKPL